MKSFADLFKGREDAYGTYSDITHAQPTDRGKRVGRAQTVTKENSPQLFLTDPFPVLFKEHLEGKRRLGSATVLPDNTCYWICLDVDHYKEIGLGPDLAQRIKDAGLPIVMTGSKSFGFHLWVFFASAIPAAKAREIAIAFKKKLKLPDAHVDIFPAQEKVGSDAKGNWVNLPYFGDTCKAFAEDGETTLSLQEFLEYANERIQHPSDLEVKRVEKAQARKSGAPPCIDWMNENGVQEGYRNIAVSHFGVYARKAFGEDWKEKTKEFNEEICDPPMTKYELAPIFKSIGADKYQYF